MGHTRWSIFHHAEFFAVAPILSRRAMDNSRNSSTDYTADLPRTAKVAKEPPLGAAGTHVLRRGSRGYDGSARGLRSRKRSSSGSLPRFFQQRRLDRTPLHGVRKLGIFRRRSRRSHFCVGLASVVAEG